MILMKPDNSYLVEIKKIALENKIPIIMDNTLEYIYKLYQNKKINNILEIGTAVGYSAICFTKLLSNEGKIDTIERDKQRVLEAYENIKKMELQDKINVIEGDAVDVLPKLNNKYDMIFIDAAKGKYPFFLKEALRLINDDGIILADNILYKGYVMSDYKQRTAVRNLREYIKEVMENPNLETTIAEVGDGLAVTKLK